MKMFGIGFGKYKWLFTVYLGNRSLDLFIWSALKRPTYVYHNKDSFKFEVEYGLHESSIFFGLQLKPKK